MQRSAAALALALILVILGLPAPVAAQGTDTLWVENFSNQPSRIWTQEYGEWRDFFTLYRGKTTARRFPLQVWEASARTPVSPSPLTSWTTVARLRGWASGGEALPNIIALRQNVTADRRGFGLELSFSPSGTDQIRLVRYQPGFAAFTLSSVDTLLDAAAYHYIKIWVEHVVVGSFTVAQVQAKVWKTDEFEPALWLLEGLSDVPILDGHDISIGAVSTTIDRYVDADFVIVLGDRSPVEPRSWGNIKSRFR